MGYRYDLTEQDDDGTVNTPTLDSLSKYLDSIEGLNEVNNGLSFTASVKAFLQAVSFQQLLFHTVNNDPALKGLPVIQFSEVYHRPADLPLHGNEAEYANFSNVHAYPYFPVPPQGTLTSAISRWSRAVPNHPVVVSENGYFTIPSTILGIDENVQAIWTLDAWADDVLMNHVEKHYIYELSDEAQDASDINDQLHYGLFRADWSPKPSAIAIHDVNAILTDSGTSAQSFKPVPFGISVSGLPTSGNVDLLENSKGYYFLVIWAEPAIWNYMLHTEITPSVSTLSIKLQYPCYIQEFDPIISSEATNVMKNTNFFAVSLSNRMLIIELRPNAAIN